MLKSGIRKAVRLLNNAADRVACETYGDTASMHAGPCERCVGYRVVGGQSNPPDPPTYIVERPGELSY